MAETERAEAATGAEAAADPIARARADVLAAALPHVPFDGWTDRTLALAAEEAGVEAALLRAAFPRGGVDLALAFHEDRDAQLRERLAREDLLGLRFRDRIAHAIALRLELLQDHREAARRAVALFALPQNAYLGARALWQTADTIWNALGDESRDYNWYTKRMTLASVYSACLLYWLGDDSRDMEATRGFIRRRIDEVMRFEEFKAQVRKNPLAAAFLWLPERLLDQVRAPADSGAEGLPGAWRGRR